MSAQPLHRTCVEASIAIARTAFAHFHRTSREDIINRGGGNICVQLTATTADDRPAKGNLVVVVDGCARTQASGEVSSVYDDLKDNFFFDDLTRFPRRVEDAPRVNYLCNEYPAAAVCAART
jgi:D-lyxose ketol-isomerase